MFAWRARGETPARRRNDSAAEVWGGDACRGCVIKEKSAFDCPCHQKSKEFKRSWSAEDRAKKNRDEENGENRAVKLV